MRNLLANAQVALLVAMPAGFARIEKQELGEGFHARYHDLAMEVLK